jgi:hypothetical protein
MLPSKIEGVAGPIWVRPVANLKAADAVRCLGTWDDATRLLKVDSALVGEQLERVFYHELIHSALDDTGLHALMTEAVTEAMCDGIGTAMLRFRKGGAFGR